MLSNVLIAKFVDTIDKISRENHKNIPGLIMSSPGFGKTSTIEKYCEYKDYNLTTLIASQYSQDDILGIQSVSNGQLVRLAPAWFNALLEKSKNGKRNVLFLDELTTCDEFIQAPLLNLIFSRSLGIHKLPENTIIIAAGNYPEELNNVFSLTAPLVNRFVILNLTLGDYEMSEVLVNRFDKTQKKEDVEAYLGLTKTEKVYNVFKLKKFILENYPFTSARIKSSSRTGLVGFNSIRSLSNSMLFAEKYFENYDDNHWTRVVGDTLGVIYSRGSEIPIFIRDHLSDNIGKFKGEDNAPVTSLDSISKELKALLLKFNNRQDTKEDAERVAELIKNNYLTDDDRSLLARISSFSPSLRKVVEENETKF